MSRRPAPPSIYRDARISPIYEGTNGIQAADLVGRKLGLDGGLAFDGLLADIRAEAQDRAADRAWPTRSKWRRRRLRDAAPDDRLAGSYPFLTMTSVMVAGWLVERMARDAKARTSAYRRRRRIISWRAWCRRRWGSERRRRRGRRCSTRCRRKRLA